LKSQGSGTIVGIVECSRLPCSSHEALEQPPQDCPVGIRFALQSFAIDAVQQFHPKIASVQHLIRPTIRTRKTKRHFLLRHIINKCTYSLDACFWFRSKKPKPILSAGPEKPD
jgi:hypothetical protein